jgi:hypothetical protein
MAPADKAIQEAANVFSMRRRELGGEACCSLEQHSGCCDVCADSHTRPEQDVATTCCVI